MKNVKLEKAKNKGWFLTIGNDNVKNRWAVTSLELWAVMKLIKDNLNTVMEELEEKQDE